MQSECCIVEFVLQRFLKALNTLHQYLNIMAQQSDRILTFSSTDMPKRSVLHIVLAVKNKFSEQLLLAISATFTCLVLWAIDFGLRKMVTGYFPGTILYGCIFLFILFGSNLFKRQEDRFEEPELIAENKTGAVERAPVQRTSLSIEQSLRFRQQLKEHFETTKAFRKQGYTIRELSNETGMPVYFISSFINQEYGINFNEFVNAYRVEYLAKMFKTTTDWESYTLEAMGKMAGFNSRSAFIAAIKKHTGMTPSAFFGRRECEPTELPITGNGQRMADVA